MTIEIEAGASQRQCSMNESTCAAILSTRFMERPWERLTDCDSLQKGSFTGFSSGLCAKCVLGHCSSKSASALSRQRLGLDGQSYGSDSQSFTQSVDKRSGFGGFDSLNHERWRATIRLRASPEPIARQDNYSNCLS
jgi:hypothetical protein